MPLLVLVARGRAGLIVPEWPLPLHEGSRVTIVAEVGETIPVEIDVKEKGLVAVDPDDAELIQALAAADREEALNMASIGVARLES